MSAMETNPIASSRQEAPMRVRSRDAPDRFRTPSGAVVSSIVMLHDFWSDIRHAVRLLRRAPGNTAIALAILGLGIGANTAMFSAINHVLLRPLPFPDSDRLLRLRDQMTGADGFPHAYNMSARNVIALKEHATVFEDIVAMSGDNMTLIGGELPARLSVVLQSDGV